MNLTSDLTKDKRLARGPLMQVILSIAQFGIRDESEDDDDYYKETRRGHSAFLIACFLAQHTNKGVEGVETDEVYQTLMLWKPMPDEDRLLLVGKLVDSLE